MISVPPPPCTSAIPYSALNFAMARTEEPAPVDADVSMDEAPAHVDTNEDAVLAEKAAVQNIRVVSSSNRWLNQTTGSAEGEILTLSLAPWIF